MTQLRGDPQGELEVMLPTCKTCLDLLALLTGRKMTMNLNFEWAHDAKEFADIMRKYRLIVSQYGNQVTVVNPFDTER